MNLVRASKKPKRRQSASKRGLSAMQDDGVAIANTISAAEFAQELHSQVGLWNEYARLLYSLPDLFDVNLVGDYADVTKRSAIISSFSKSTKRDAFLTCFAAALAEKIKDINDVEVFLTGYDFLE